MGEGQENGAFNLCYLLLMNILICTHPNIL